MKKVLILFCMTMSLLVSNVFAQEVHGISTRRVVYESDNTYYGSNGSSGKYYGWEVKNNNSIKVSVDITLYHQGTSAVWTNGYDAVPVGSEKKVVKTQSIILKPGESYTFKREEHRSTRVDAPDSDNPISSYFIECKAYKLQ